MNIPSLSLWMSLGILGGIAVHESSAAQPGEPARPSVESIKAEVKPHQDVPMLWINGKPELLFVYRDHRPQQHIETVKRFMSHGVRMVTVGANPAGRTTSKEKEKVYHDLDEKAAGVLEKSPDTLLMVIVNTSIRKKWNSAWLKAHPDEVAIWPPNMTLGDRPAIASKVWQDELCDEIRDLVDHVRRASFGGKVVGYLFCGPPGEWTDYYDFSKPALEGFRQWLRERYPDLTALRKAWRDDKATWESALLPTWKSLLNADQGVFYDPQKSRQKIDYLLYHHSIPARVIGRFAQVVKKASHGESIVGLFHGYFTDTEWDGDDSKPWLAGQFRMRHKSLSQLVENPSIDFVLAPYAYQERHAGGVFDPSLIPNTILLHGKMAVVEDDTRTHTTTPHPSYQVSERSGDNFGQARNPQETVSLLQRNFAGSFSKPGSGMWYFGLSDRGNEWFDDPTTLECIRTLGGVAREHLLGKDRPVSQIAVIGSYRAACYQTFNNLPKEFITRQFCENLHRLGAPFDLYLDTDLSHPRFPFDRYKFYIFLNTFYFSDQERTLIKEKVCTGNRSVLWVWASGFVSDERLSLENTQALTGIRLRKEDLALDSVRCVVSNYTSPLTAGLPTSLRFGPDRMERLLTPLFSVDDPQAEVLGELLATTDKYKVYTFRRPGLCVKQVAGMTSIWSGVPNLPSCLLRNVARTAGVHIYDDGDDQVLASERLLGVHARYAGPRTVRLPRPSNVYDPFRKEYLGKGVTELKISLPAGGTGLWVLE